MHIRDEIRKCVAFLAWKKPNRGEGDFIGTCFFTGMTVSGNRAVTYAVTARHVIEDIKKKDHDGCVYFRLNGMDGEARWVKVQLNDWITHPPNLRRQKGDPGTLVPRVNSHSIARLMAMHQKLTSTGNEMETFYFLSGTPGGLRRSAN